MTKKKEKDTGEGYPRIQHRLAVGVDEGAEMLSISSSKLWMMLRCSEIPRVRLGGRTVVRIRDLETYMNRCVDMGENVPSPLGSGGAA